MSMVKSRPARIARAGPALPSRGFCATVPSMNAHHDDEARKREADAILTRLRQETEPQIGASTERMVLRAGEHFSARDVDQSDRIEVVGTRIGRLAGLAGFLVLAVMFVVNHLLP
ncbi:hypothetical protein [Aureimonas populi]|uniref:DUF3618 domain-containing protein n=1 Tax=Aureimonas populi TaxID=1701758 RepID=A0ABW5CRI9_9HYPH|nr:hypothetical protein [Aureimonas populi]